MIDLLIFFETNYSNYNRYVIPFVNFLNESHRVKKVIIAYEEFANGDKIDLSSCKSNVSKTKINKDLLKSSGKKNIFFTYSYRIPDLYWTYHFKKNGFHCYQSQHGMYADFLKRDLSGYFLNINRNLVYLRYLLKFLITGKFNIFIYLLNKDFIKSTRIKENYLPKHSENIIEVQSNFVFIWGEYWRKWFKENHYYLSDNNFKIIGNPDYHSFVKNKRREELADNICYIAQTFVEDGRMKRNDYIKIIEKFSLEIKDKLIVKLHPRSDITIYESVIKNGGKLTQEFPIAGICIGHYSSLLALALNDDSIVMLLKINDEDIPYYFRNSANNYYEDIELMIYDIKNKNFGERKEEISYYFQNINTNPFQIKLNFLLNSQSK